MRIRLILKNFILTNLTTGNSYAYQGMCITTNTVPHLLPLSYILFRVTILIFNPYRVASPFQSESRGHLNSCVGLNEFPPSHKFYFSQLYRLSSSYYIIFSWIIYVISQCPSETEYIWLWAVDHFSNGWVSNRDKFGLEDMKNCFIKKSYWHKENLILVGHLSIC